MKMSYVVLPGVDTKKTGAKIRSLRMEAHLTVRGLADLLGLESDQSVYKWQRGDSVPTIDNCIALATIFNVSLDELIVRTDYGEEDRESSSSHVSNTIRMQTYLRKLAG